MCGNGSVASKVQIISIVMYGNGRNGSVASKVQIISIVMYGNGSALMYSIVFLIVTNCCN